MMRWDCDDFPFWSSIDRQVVALYVGATVLTEGTMQHASDKTWRVLESASSGDLEFPSLQSRVQTCAQKDSWDFHRETGV